MTSTPRSLPYWPALPSIVPPNAVILKETSRLFTRSPRSEMLARTSSSLNSVGGFPSWPGPVMMWTPLAFTPVSHDDVSSSICSSWAELVARCCWL